MATRKRKKPRRLRKVIPRRFSHGDFNPVLNWIEVNGEIPNGGALTFDLFGNNVSLDEVQCKRTYFTASRKYAKVPGCPAMQQLIQMVDESRAEASDAAEQVKAACELDPECKATITLHARSWECTGGPFGPSQVHAGHCFRIVCKK